MNLIGQRFGRLLVIKRSRTRTSDGRLRWDCVCDCGEKRKVTSYHLNSGNTQSCGCMRKKYDRENLPEYTVWSNMKHRCNPELADKYPEYAGRGITVCRRWEKFENFFADMGTRPNPKYHLDRINNNLGYSKRNCRWVSARVNMNNRRSTRFVVYKGERWTVANLARKYGMATNVLYGRIFIHDWDITDAVVTPVVARHAKS